MNLYHEHMTVVRQRDRLVAAIESTVKYHEQRSAEWDEMGRHDDAEREANYAAFARAALAKAGVL